MTLNNQDFTMPAGRSRTLVVLLSDDTGAPLDPSSAQRIDWLLQDYATRQLVAQKGLNGGVSIPGSPTNAIEIAIEPIDTLNMAGDFFHQIRLVDADGNDNITTQGRVTITRAGNG